MGSSTSSTHHWDRWGPRWASICASCVCKAPSWVFSGAMKGKLGSNNNNKKIKKNRWEKIITAIAMMIINTILIYININQTATNTSWPHSHLRVCNFTVCLQGVGRLRWLFSEIQRLQRREHTWTAPGLHLLAQLPTSESCYEVHGDANRPHEKIVVLLKPQTNLQHKLPATFMHRVLKALLHTKIWGTARMKGINRSEETTGNQREWSISREDSNWTGIDFVTP